MEFSLLWAALTAFAAAWVGLRVFDERLPERPMDPLITAGLVGLAVGRVTAMIVSGVNPLTHLSDLIVVRGGVDTAAASIAFIAALVWATRETRNALDAIAPAVLVGLAGWHAGCLWRGTCLGTPSELPWAWSQTGSAVTRHPVEIYAAIGFLIGAFLVSRVGWTRWSRAAVALAVAGGVRVATEPLRPSITGGPVVWYLAGMIAGVIIFLASARMETARST